MANLSDCEEEGCFCEATDAFVESTGQQNWKVVEASQLGTRTVRCNSATDLRIKSGMRVGRNCRFHPWVNI